MSPDASERAVEAVDDLVDGRDETPNERADRNWTEALQELRVMQTGTQILAGFLVALHRALFGRWEKRTVVLYGHAALVVALATAAALLVGVVAFVFDVVIGGVAAVIVAVVAIVLVAVLWLVIPLILRAKGADA